MATDQVGEINKYDFQTETQEVFRAEKGLNAEIVNQISDIKNEPDWGYSPFEVDGEYLTIRSIPRPAI